VFAEAFIGPGVTVGEAAVVGARAGGGPRCGPGHDRGGESSQADRRTHVPRMNQAAAAIAAKRPEALCMLPHDGSVEIGRGPLLFCFWAGQGNHFGRAGRCGCGRLLSRRLRVGERCQAVGWSQSGSAGLPRVAVVVGLVSRSPPGPVAASGSPECDPSARPVGCRVGGLVHAAAPSGGPGRGQPEGHARAVGSPAEPLEEKGCLARMATQSV